MKIVKCGKISECNYCIVRLAPATGASSFSHYNLYVEVTNDKQLEAKFKEDNIDAPGFRYEAISNGIVSIGMNGKPKTKFRDRKFARFYFKAISPNDAMILVESFMDRIFEFKMLADLEGIMPDETLEM